MWNYADVYTVLFHLLTFFRSLSPLSLLSHRLPSPSVSLPSVHFCPSPPFRTLSIVISVSVLRRKRSTAGLFIFCEIGSGSPWVTTRWCSRSDSDAALKRRRSLLTTGFLSSEVHPGESYWLLKKRVVESRRSRLNDAVETGNEPQTCGKKMDLIHKKTYINWSTLMMNRSDKSNYC